MENNETNLTEQEILFCELYAHGQAPFGGNAPRCYGEAFKVNPDRCKIKAVKLLSKKPIQEYLNSLEALSYQEAKYAKTFLRENLISIISECSTAIYSDRLGKHMSPAALRSVAVNASKALMELYPVREAQVSKLDIGSGENVKMSFNVVLPGQVITETKNVEPKKEADD